MRSFHNTSPRLIECLTEAGIDTSLLSAYIVRSLDNNPKPQSIKEAVRYKIMSIQAERMVLLLAS